MFFTSPQPEISPTGDNDELNDWAAGQNSDLRQYQQRYAAAMRLKGVTVSFQPQAAVTGPFTLIDPGSATLSRDGITVPVLVSRGRAQTATPEALAEYDFQFALPAKPNPNLATTPPSFFNPAPSPPLIPTTPPPLGPTTPPVAITPPSTSTVPTPPPIERLQPPTVSPIDTLQPEQRPKNPPEGTVVNTGLTGLYTFEQWNYIMRERTGKVGPDPRAYGIDTAYLMDLSDYQEILARLEKGENPGFGGIEPREGVTPPPSNNLNPNPPKEPKKTEKDNTAIFIVGAVIVLLLINR